MSTQHESDVSQGEEVLEEALAAYDPPGEAPPMWCELPPPDQDVWAAGEQLVLDGWAFARDTARLQSVDVDVEGIGGFRAYRGLPRLDVIRTFPEDPDADRAGWRLRVTTEGWPAGDYRVRITARDDAGRETSVRRDVSVDPASAEAYERWLAHRQTLQTADGGRELPATISEAPTFAVCVLGGDAAARDRTLASIEAQPYPHRETLGTTELPAAAEAFLASGADYLVTAWAGDVLEPHALRGLAGTWAGEQRADVLYADSDVLGTDGDRVRPSFKPEWSPEFLLATDYVGPFLAVGRRAVGLATARGDAPPASPYELLLRLVDEDVVVKRIADVLYTRASVIPVDDEADVGAFLADLGRRRGMAPEIAPAPVAGMRTVGWPLDGEPKVSIVIATAFRDGLVWQCLRSLQGSTYRNFEVILVTSGFEGPAAEAPADVGEFRLVEYAGGFNYSAVNNAGAGAAAGEYLLFLNDDVEIETPDWLQRLLEHAQQPGVGVVGAKLVYPDGTLQLGGQLLVDTALCARLMGVGTVAGDPGPRGVLSVPRNVSSVGGACMVLSAELFEALGGFDETLEIEYGDVDLCLRALAAKRRVVWTPRAVLTHHERSSRGATPHSADALRFRVRWDDLLRSGDPYYNPNLGQTIADEFQLPQRPDLGRELAGSGGTVERFVPETMGGLLEAEHLARYYWAAPTVLGKTVLDAGCGVGYGSVLLAAAGATSVVGVDVAEAAIENARSRAGDSTEFVVGDLCNLPFADDSFEVVVCFEAIEHVEDWERAFDELRRVLRADGLLAISTPNRDVYPGGNPFHIHEFTPHELTEALSRRFANVELHHQHDWESSMVIDNRGSATADPAEILGADTRKLAPIDPGSELYAVAIASDAQLPSLRGVAVISSPIDFSVWVDRIRGLERRLQFSAEERRRITADHARVATEHELLVGDYDLLEAERDRISSENAQLAAERAELQHAIEALRSSLSWRVAAPVRAAGALLRRGRGGS